MGNYYVQHYVCTFVILHHTHVTLLRLVPGECSREIKTWNSLQKNKNQGKKTKEKKAHNKVVASNSKQNKRGEIGRT